MLQGFKARDVSTWGDSIAHLCYRRDLPETLRRPGSNLGRKRTNL